MKAIVLHGPGQYSYESDWQEPTVSVDWSLVRVHYSGICGSDIPRFSYSGSYHHPMILGHEFSGTIEQPLGNSKFKRGDPVSVLPIIPCGKCESCMQKMGPFHCNQYAFIGSRNNGGFAELCAVPDTNLFPLPSADHLKQGALIEPMAVALHAVRRSAFASGKTAIVFGAGPIGLLVGLWLKLFGARQVVMADIRDINLTIAKSVGLDNTINPLEFAIHELPAFDYAFEAAGSSKAVTDSISMLSPCGKLTIVGRDIKDTTIPLKSFELMMRKELTVSGCWGYDMTGEWNFVSDVFSNNRFPLEKLISHEVSIEDASDIIRAMCEKLIEYCKVLIRMQ